MAVQVFIDGVELDVPVIGGIYALQGSVTRRLNRPSQATINVPMEYAIGNPGSKLKILIPGHPGFHGLIMDREVDTGEDTGTTVFNAMDPLELWEHRVVRDPPGSLTPGNFIDPDILEDFETGPQIIEAMMLASENPAGIPETAEGPLFLEYGSFEGGGENLSGAPAGWPTTMMELASMLTSTGELDIIITPIDSGGNMGRIDCYNGEFGNNLVGSVAFQYGLGARNVRRFRQNSDMANMTNKLQYFYGPKETVRRYKSNTTIDDPCLEMQVGPGPVAALDSRRMTSRAAYGVRMEIQEFDVEEMSREQEPEGTCVELDPFKILYRINWYTESWIRAVPRTITHITPIRGAGISDFDLGDIIRITASAEVNGGFDEGQRVYEYTVSWGDDGVLECSEIQTSADQEGGL